MFIREKKVCLEIYGLCRMSLGVAELVGVSAAYFLKEFIMQYPPQVVALVLSKDVVVLSVLAYLFRGVFHIAGGIGIARLNGWVRLLLIYGWPLMLVITWGLGHTLYKEWQADGVVTNIFQVLSWPKLLCYFAWVIFDVSWVNQTIKAINQNKEFGQGDGARVEIKKIAGLFFATTVFFVLLFFLGRSVKQGFHQGFYKVRGDQSTKEEILIQEKSDAPTIKSPAVVARTIDATKKADSTWLASELKETQAGRASDKTYERPSITKNENFPYNLLLIYCSALCFITGLFLQLIDSGRVQGRQKVCLSTYIMFGSGAMLLMIFTTVKKYIFMTFFCFTAFVLCLMIIFSQWKYLDKK